MEIRVILGNCEKYWKYYGNIDQGRMVLLYECEFLDLEFY